MMGMSEINIGMNLPPGFSTIIQCKVVPRVHSEICQFGKYYKNEECLKLGIIDRLVPRANIMKEALTFAATLAPKCEKRLNFGDIKKVVYDRSYHILTKEPLNERSAIVHYCIMNSCLTYQLGPARA
jgi:enoyl-CoA hydratase/carnithine racemase